MSEFASRKLRVVSFLAIILIVVLHSNLAGVAQGYEWVIQRFMTSEITRISVPVFFMISGLLFFYNYESDFGAFYVGKLKKRIKTLVIPYLIFSSFGYIVIMAAWYLTDVKPNCVTMTGFKSVFYYILWHPIGCYQLWFVRDLFLMVLISPVLYVMYCNRWTAGFYILILTVLYFISNSYSQSLQSIFYFSVGAYIGLRRRSCIEIRAKSKIGMFATLTVWLALCSMSSMSGHEWIHRVAIVVGIAAFWQLYDVCLWRIGWEKSGLVSFTFFIYLLHEPLLTVVKRINLALFGADYTMITYILSPIFTICILWVSGKALSKHFPKCYRIISGGR